ncbi:hypothetical protein WJX73_002460 [Symbiochloris irregularis]|uniref:Prefoldin subunit 3 n=1 Tax=Symbiochloris irregularis TaxID=706552 RepID=A0AAW1PJZ8_9CHLO
MATAEAEPLIQAPVAQYIKDVAEYLQGRSTDEVLQTMSRNLSAYSSIEAELLQQKARMMGKIPDIKKSLAIVELLQRKQDEGQSAVFDFSLAEQVYAKAKVEQVTTVNLWLGANVMLEYPLDEANNLLSTSLENATKSLKDINTQIDYIKDSITTTQVNQARVYNYDVVQRKNKPTEDK